MVAAPNMARVTRLCCVIPVVLAVMAVACAEARPTMSSAQLDSDAALESVSVERGSARDCGGSESCSRVVLIDGSREVALSSFRQRGEPSNFLWSVEHLRTLDLTGDRAREIFWKQVTSGGTASSPLLFAVERWDGRRASRIFTLRITHAASGFAYSMPYEAKVIPPRGGLRELATTEGLYDKNRATCCPNAVRHRRYRWNGRRMALVAGSTHLTAMPAPDRQVTRANVAVASSTAMPSQ
jgi:hypothetical protein